MECKDCKHFKPVQLSTVQGECKRYPPTIVTVFENEYWSSGTYFPVVANYQYCGEHAARLSVVTNEGK